MAVLKTLETVKKWGFDIKFLPVDKMEWLTQMI